MKPILKCALIPALLLMGHYLFAQNKKPVDTAPGFITEFYWWHAEHDLAPSLGNYHSVDLLKLKSFSDQQNLNFSEDNIIFLVLKPNKKPNGAAFLKVGDLLIFDDHIVIPNQEIPIEYQENQAAIIGVQQFIRMKHSIFTHIFELT